MIKRFKKLKSILIIITILALGYYGYTRFSSKSTSSGTVNITAEAKIGDIEDSIKVTGSAELIDEQKIRFNQVGKVAKIYFKEGAKVKKGQVIAELDKEDANNTIRQAEINLSNSKLTLENDLKPLEEKDRIKYEGDQSQAENNLQNARTSYDNLLIEKSNKIQDSENSIASKQADIISKNAQLNLEKQKLALLKQQQDKSTSDTSTNITKSLSTAYSDIRKYLSSSRELMTASDEYLGITELNKNRNDQYEQYISAKNLNFKAQAEADWGASDVLLDKLSTDYAKVNKESYTAQEILDLLSSAQKLYDSMVTLGIDASEAAKASIPSTNYPQSTIDSDYSKMLNIKTQSQSSYDTIKTSIANIKTLTDPDLIKRENANSVANQLNTIDNLENTITTMGNDLESLKLSLELMKKEYEAKVSQASFNIKNLENSLELNKANYEYAKRGATKQQIQRDRNDITKQEIAVSDAKKTLDKYRIEAPFDGILRQIDFKVGDNLISDDTKYLYIDNPNLLEITATLDQIDVAKVRVGQDVSIVFDSFPKQTFTGAISQINSSPLQTSGVTSYQIKMTMDKGNYSLFSGMTAKVNIIVEKKTDVLLIPSSFVTKEGNLSTVLVSESGSELRKEIITGIDTNSYVEILSGLNEGETVIRKIVTATASTQTTLIGTPGQRNQNGGRSSGSSRSSGGGFRPD